MRSSPCLTGLSCTAEHLVVNACLLNKLAGFSMQCTQARHILGNPGEEAGSASQGFMVRHKGARDHSCIDALALFGSSLTALIGLALLRCQRIADVHERLVLGGQPLHVMLRGLQLARQIRTCMCTLYGSVRTALCSHTMSRGSPHLDGCQPLQCTYSPCVPRSMSLTRPTCNSMILTPAAASAW